MGHIARLTDRNVIEMVKAGLGAEVVVANMQSSQCAFDMSP
jgi:hypothetical protein